LPVRGLEDHSDHDGFATPMPFKGPGGFTRPMNSDPRKPPGSISLTLLKIDQFLLVGFAYSLLSEVYLVLRLAHLTW
jgi:hypothetical protein